MNSYQRLTYLVPARREEDFVAEAWGLGCLGCEVRPASGVQVEIDVYFLAPESAERGEISLGLPDPSIHGATLKERSTLSDQDWLQPYREAAQPFDVGRFRIDPRDPDLGEEEAAPEGRWLLRLPARTAFGTGSHESTRLALLWLEELELEGCSVLDVGTGSAILSLAALMLGARQALGFDFDPGSVLIARENARRHGLAPHLYAGRIGALGAGACFDVALVNVLPERILPEFPILLCLLRQGGQVVSSGNLISQRDELLGRFKALGLGLEGEKVEGDWISFRLRYDDPKADHPKASVHSTSGKHLP